MSTTLTLEEGESGADLDTFVIEGDADTAKTTSTSLWVRSGVEVCNTLLRFDLTSIPAGATIVSGVLSLFYHEVRGGHNAITYYANRILPANAGWVEACTWNYADGAGASARWAGDTGGNGGSDAGCSVSGTDFSAVAATATGFTDDSAGTQYDFSLDVDEIASMIANNAGIRVNSDWAGYAVYFCSAEHATAAYRPKLVVVYEEAGGDPQTVTLTAITSAEAMGAAPTTMFTLFPVGIPSAEVVGSLNLMYNQIVTLVGVISAELVNSVLAKLVSVMQSMRLALRLIH